MSVRPRCASLPRCGLGRNPHTRRLDGGWQHHQGHPGQQHRGHHVGLVGARAAARVHRCVFPPGVRVCVRVCVVVCVWGGGGDGGCLALQVLPREVAAPRPAASSTWPPAAARRPWTDAERLSCAPHRASEEDWTLDSSVAHNCYAYCKRESERLAYELAQGQR
jgi:hypothetical protein